MPKGKYSFVAGGKFNYPLGTASHVQGYKNLAGGDASHAQGQLTVAAGDYSHAEGFQTRANSSYSHAQGYKTRTGVPSRPCILTNLNPNNQTVVIEGVFESEYKENNLILFTYKSFKRRFRTKRRIKNLSFDLENNKTTFLISPPLTGTPTSIRAYNQSIGKYAHAQGVGTSASGDFSTAIGKNISVTGHGSVGIQLNNTPNQVLSKDNTFAIIGGKVGIGTLNPECDVEINGDLKVGNLTFYSDGSVSGSPSFDNILIQGDTISNINQNGLIVLSTDGDGSLELSSKSISIGKFAKTRLVNQHAQAGTCFFQSGDAQESKYFLIKQTSNTNYVSLTFDGDFESPNNLISIPEKSTWMFKITISAYNSTNNLKAAMSLRGALGNDGLSCDFIGEPIFESFLDDGMQSLGIKIECNTGFFKIKVAGISGQSIKWHAIVNVNEVYHI